MNMTKIGEHDRKLDNDEPQYGEHDWKYNKYYHNDKPKRVNMIENWK